MRIVVDMQGAQTASRFRGIGRYTTSFIKSVIVNKKEHEVFLVLNGMFEDSVNEIRRDFKGIIPSTNIFVWYAPKPATPNISISNYKFAEIIREQFIADLCPDIIHLTSLFEGYADNSVTSVHKVYTKARISVMLYDLIPFLSPEKYLDLNPGFRSHYMSKIKYLISADLVLSISDFSRQECLENLKISADKVVNISTAVEPFFRKLDQSIDHVNEIKTRFGISKKFVLYTGGADERKNLIRLIAAYAKLSKDLRRDFQLVLVGRITESQMIQIDNSIDEHRLTHDEVKFTGYIDDDQLLTLYNCASLLIFPSWHEGFGLPALEAMSCGLPVIASNTGSLPEVVGLEDALFDPFSVDSISERLTQALQNTDFRAFLSDHGVVQAKKFNWDLTAKRAIQAWKNLLCAAQDTSNLSFKSNPAQVISLLKDCDSSALINNKYAIANAVALNLVKNNLPKAYIDISAIRFIEKNNENSAMCEFLNYLTLDKNANVRFSLSALDRSLLTPKEWSTLSLANSINGKNNFFDRPDLYSGDLFFIPIFTDMSVSGALVEIIKELCAHGIKLNLIIWSYPLDTKGDAINEYLLPIIDYVSISGGKFLISKNVFNSNPNSFTIFGKISNEDIFKNKEELINLINLSIE
jgi:glycosyltransferase involved in cell wall biosynthesis